MGSGMGSAFQDRVGAALEVNLQRSLNPELVDLADPAAGVRFPVRGLALTPFGTLHAGALGAIIELAAYLAVAPTLAADEHAVTTSIATQFVRAAPAEHWVTVRGELTRRARRIAFVVVTATLDGTDQVIATGQVTKSVVSA
ncbi:PaaI family thioesterase [Nocardia rhamnosiphila]|uniref:PaaI family thioesterase n=1 Tax=Nocardia rhamnosiphila TaxID=426716 RepID=UPI0033D8B680